MVGGETAAIYVGDGRVSKKTRVDTPQVRKWGKPKGWTLMVDVNRVRGPEKYSNHFI